MVQFADWVPGEAVFDMDSSMQEVYLGMLSESIWTGKGEEAGLGGRSRVVVQQVEASVLKKAKGCSGVGLVQAT